jgi:hypothetical protein
MSLRSRLLSQAERLGSPAVSELSLEERMERLGGNQGSNDATAWFWPRRSAAPYVGAGWFSSAGCRRPCLPRTVWLVNQPLPFHFQQFRKPRRGRIVVRVAFGVTIKVIRDGQVHRPKGNVGTRSTSDYRQEAHATPRLPRARPKGGKTHATGVRMCGIGTFLKENTANAVENERADEWLAVFPCAITPIDLLHLCRSIRHRLIQDTTRRGNQ